MFWNLILVSVFGACAFAMYYPSESEEAAYEMQKLLDIGNFMTIQDEMRKIAAALDEDEGLEHKADKTEQKLDKLSPQIEYLCQITKDLASPCREGIFRGGKCVNYIRKDKFKGSEEDAMNLCHAHFGRFKKEDIIDYSDGPYGNHGEEEHHDSYGHGGGFYGDGAASQGGFYGDSPSQGGFYGDAPAPNEGGTFGDAPPPNYGDHGGDEASPSLPPPVTYYVCYEPPAINVPKNIYFPAHEYEEEEGEEGEGEGEGPPGGYNPFPTPGSDIWFSGKFDPEFDEDECPLFAHHGKVIGKLCITLYDEPREWQTAQDACKARGGTLWEPEATIAESTVAYAMLKAKFGGIIANIETAADPNQSNIIFAKIWTGWKQVIASTTTDFESQIGPGTVDISYAIFQGLVIADGLAAAMVQPGTSWEGLYPATKLPYACQFNLVKK